MLRVVMLSVIMLNFCNTECGYAECRRSITAVISFVLQAPEGGSVAGSSSHNGLAYFRILLL
jgi:hypothetical protein